MNQSVYESADINQVENEQKLRSEGKLLNDKITYNEQENYYGEGKQQNEYDEGQQQTENYLEQQGYEQEGQYQEGEYYQQEQQEQQEQEQNYQEENAQ